MMVIDLVNLQYQKILFSYSPLIIYLRIESKYLYLSQQDLIMKREIASQVYVHRDSYYTFNEILVSQQTAI